MVKVKFNPDIAQDFIERALNAAASDVKLDISDPNQIPEIFFSAFSVVVGLVPYVGPAFAYLMNLVGAAVFPKATPDIWQEIEKPIENLIDAKIGGYHVKVLQGRIRGLEENYEAYQNGFITATGSVKDQQAEILREHYVAFLAVLPAVIPDFQLEDYAPLSLPYFALAANVHLPLLVDGIKHGADWATPTRFPMELCLLSSTTR